MYIKHFRFPSFKNFRLRNIGVKLIIIENYWYHCDAIKQRSETAKIFPLGAFAATCAGLFSIGPEKHSNRFDILVFLQEINQSFMKQFFLHQSKSILILSFNSKKYMFYLISFCKGIGV